MQRLPNKACQEPDEVRDDLIAYVGEHLGHGDGVLIVDEAGSFNEGAGRAQRQPVIRVPPPVSGSINHGAMARPRLRPQPARRWRIRLGEAQR